MTSPYKVSVVEEGLPTQKGWNRCEIGRHIEVDPYGLHSYYLARWNAIVFDAFIVAAAIQYCDSMKGRPDVTWGRDFRLRIPVHDPDRWNSDEVSSKLHSTLNLGTGDSWQISFTARKKTFQPEQSNFVAPSMPAL